MKKISIFLTTILFVMTGCGEGKQSTDELIIVDVTKSYSTKKELILQDFMDVEYVALETNRDFVNQGVVLDIGKKYILIRNRKDDGDIFVYDRTGKAIRKINRRGQGNEEYARGSLVFLDEDNEEMLVNDTNKRKFFVYDLYGNLKRSFNHKEDPEAFAYREAFNNDRDNLICHDQYDENISFVLLSKQDGSITKEIKIPFKERKSIGYLTGDYIMMPIGPYNNIISFNGDWILSEHSSDTVYAFLPDSSLRPFLVRTPSIQSMDPEVFLIVRLLSDRYYFMETIKNIFNSETGSGFTKTFFVYDKQENDFFGYTVYNGDYSIKKEIYMNALSPVNREIELCQSLEPFQLIESYKKGELKGELKEIAAKLSEEDNPVIMLVKQKK